MTRPSRTRRILKWTGAGLSVLILVIWALSLEYGAKWRVGQKSLFFIYAGELKVYASDFPAPNVGTSVWPLDVGKLGWSGFSLNGPIINSDQFLTEVVVPFWLPFLVTALPTAWLWHRDRRRIRPGCCLRCGYDLTGNTSGVCSECGLPATPSHDASV